MKKILYIPLDERSCNKLYPLVHASSQEDMEILLLPAEFLGSKKEPADINGIWNWFEKTIGSCDAAIISLEMLYYGGLIYSRIHYFSENELLGRMNKLIQIMDSFPTVKFYLSGLVMRCPTYSSDEEEPDYYAFWGKEIAELGMIEDKKNQKLETPEDQSRGIWLRSQISQDDLKDYLDRRQKNLILLEKTLEHYPLTAMIIIPQDDSSPFGYSCIDRRKILKFIQVHPEARVFSYPGADESGCTLMSRTIQDFRGKLVKTYIHCSHKEAYEVIPKYEDQPLKSSINTQIEAAGGLVVETPVEADVILVINGPIEHSREASDQDPYNSSEELSDRKIEQHLTNIVLDIEEFLTLGKPLGIADLRFTNGGDCGFIHLLDKHRILDRINSYSGWNTNGNSLGIVLGSLFLQPSSPGNLPVRILEDWCYQSMVRQQIRKEQFPLMEDQSMEAEFKRKELAQTVLHLLDETWKREIPNSFLDFKIKDCSLFFPWSRSFDTYFIMNNWRYK